MIFLIKIVRTFELSEIEDSRKSDSHVQRGSHQMCSIEKLFLGKDFQNIYFEEHLQTAASTYANSGQNKLNIIKKVKEK